ncbi:MAG: helix-hairpin-helix domain-containing protein [Pseudomonadota bacterium]
MTGSLTTFIPLIIIGLVLLVIAVWLLMRLGKSTDVVGDGTLKRDVLDEGAAPAARNQALIDAAPAVVPSPTPEAEAEPTLEPARIQNSAPEPHASSEPTSPVPAAIKAAPVSDPTGAADDLRQIKGIGPKLVTMLAEEGITRFEQIAAWSESDIESIDEKLGRFQGRIVRDQWVKQAKLLISGDKNAYAERFGNNG